ncbi:MAG: glycosyltransferase family 4 protein [Verrucomicrobiota bacterium]
MIKFVIYTHEFLPYSGGVGTYCAELAKALKKADHDVEVWAPDYLSSQPNDKNLCYSIKRISNPGTLKIPSLIGMGWHLYKALNDLKGKMIILPSVGVQIVFMVGYLLRLIPHELVKNCICIWHGSEIFKFESNSLLNLASRNFFHRVHMLASASKYSSRNIYGSILSELTSRIVTLPCACSSAAIRDDVTTESEPEGRIRILTLARIHHRKGHFEIIAALNKLPQELKDRVIYYVAGNADGPKTKRYLGELRMESRRNKINMKYLGSIAEEDLAQVYRNCEIYAMTSRTLKTSVEGFGITYLEAGYHEKPVIAYRTGGVAEAVKNGETGILIDEGDRETLAKELEKLILDESLRKSLGQAGRAHAKNFSWDNTAQKLIEELQKRD